MDGTVPFVDGDAETIRAGVGLNCFDQGESRRRGMVSIKSLEASGGVDPLTTTGTSHNDQPRIATDQKMKIMRLHKKGLTI